MKLFTLGANLILITFAIEGVQATIGITHTVLKALFNTCKVTPKASIVVTANKGHMHLPKYVLMIDKKTELP